MSLNESSARSGLVIFIGSDEIGRGDDRQLGELLIQKFLHALGGKSQKPENIVFMNSGVRLVVQDSPVLGELKQLESQGVELLACGTCLSRFHLTEKVAVGEVSNMLDITDTMLRAAKVISL